jgi:hypothetical protein
MWEVIDSCQASFDLGLKSFERMDMSNKLQEHCVNWRPIKKLASKMCLNSI